MIRPAADPPPTDALPRPPLLLALDVGGTKLAAGVVALEGRGSVRILARRHAPSDRADGPEPMIDRLIALGRASLDAAGVAPGDLAAVGVACGGPLDPRTGIISSPPNLPGWHDVPLGARIAEAFGVRVAVENDATAATLAEHLFGAGRGFDDVVYFTISTGIGGGAIVGGRLVRGATGNATELGHLLVDPGGRPCACGRRGCLEGFASGTNIAARAREAIARGEESVLSDPGRDPDRITAEMVADAARVGDPHARRIWDATTDAIAAGVANAINAFDPDVVVLGGGVTRAGDLLFEPVRRGAIAQAMPPMRRHVRVVAAELGEHLGVVAAAAAAIDRFAPATPDEGAGEAALTAHLAAADALRPLLPSIDEVGRLICEALAAGGRIYAFGNGGSAADAQHFAAELVGHFRRDRRSLPAVALTTDPSVVTAIANDFTWQDVFARQVDGAVRPGDLVVAISTSGNAENVIRGIRAARAAGATTVALTGGDGGRLAGEADRALVMPARTTDRIQELHTFVVHVLSEQVDAWAAATERGER